MSIYKRKKSIMSSHSALTFYAADINLGLCKNLIMRINWPMFELAPYYTLPLKEKKGG